MSVSQHLIFNSSITADGTWQDISKFEPGMWSIHIIGIETGATVTVELSNVQGAANNEPTQGIPTTAGVSNSLTVVGNQAIFSTSTYANWVRVRKTQGGTPTSTKAYFCGLIEQ